MKSDNIYSEKLDMLQEKIREEAIASEKNILPLIFLSYSHNDYEHMEKLKTHLLGLGPALGKGLKRSEFIVLWCDDEIQGGDDWKDKIFEALDQVKVVILILSADFLASEFIMNKEVPKALELKSKTGLRIYPILATSCFYKCHNWLVKMQIRPKPPLPIWNNSGECKSDELAKIAEEVYYMIKDNFIRMRSHGTAANNGRLQKKVVGMTLVAEKDRRK